MAKRTGIGSYTADDSESGRSVETQDDIETVNSRRSNKRRKKRDPQPDPDRIQKDLDRYREEMAEDAPASNLPEDNRRASERTAISHDAHAYGCPCGPHKLLTFLLIHAFAKQNQF